jgi:hypothetical protein
VENERHFMKAREEAPLALTHEWQSEIAQKARSFGYIAVDHICYLLAMDRQYSDQLLPRIWKSFQCNIRGPYEPRIHTPKLRAGTWLTLLFRWTFGTVGGIPDGLEAIPLLPVYHYNKAKGKLELPPADKKTYYPCYVRLDELEKYFKETIGIPIPKSLFVSSSDDNAAVFPCDPGTRWSDITITLLSNEMVRIKTPKGEQRLTYHELGMKDRRAGDRPTLLWVLLKLFAESKGFISSKSRNFDRALPDTAKRLNDHMKKLFRIDESLYVGHYKKEKGYRTKIIFLNNTTLSA